MQAGGGKSGLGFFGLTFFNVVEDAGRLKRTPNRGVALGANFGLGRFKFGEVDLLGLRDGAVDVFGQEFGVAVVWNHACFEWLRFGEVARGLKPEVVGDR